MTENTNDGELELLINKNGIEIQDPENPLEAWIRTDTNGEDLLYNPSKEKDNIL